MNKIIFCIIVCFLSSNNYCFAAEQLVLSDVIKEARDVQIKLLAENKKEKELTKIQNKEVSENQKVIVNEVEKTSNK